MKRRALALGMALVLVCCAGGCAATNQEMYERAQLYLGYGDYEGAQYMFLQLGEFADSAEYALYCAGLDALENDDAALARANFEEIAPFKSTNRCLRYLDALDAEAEDRPEEALALYAALGSFRDCPERAASMREAIPRQQLEHAKALMAAGHHEQALVVLESLGGYEDAPKLAAACQDALVQAAYDQARALYDGAQYEEALSAFDALGDTLDAKARVLLCRSALYQQAEQDYQQVTAVTAAELMARYRDFGSYLESAVRLAALERRFGTTLRLMDAVRPHVCFAAYPTEESGAPSPLCWQVLSVEDGVALLLCDRVLDALPLAEASALSLTMTEAERAGLVSLSLPGLDELSSLLPEADWRCAATAYAAAQGVRHHEDGSAWWWLRDQREDGRQEMVWFTGETLSGGMNPSEACVGVRPMLRVDLTRWTVTAGDGTEAAPFRSE